MNEGIKGVGCKAEFWRKMSQQVFTAIIIPRTTRGGCIRRGRIDGDSRKPTYSLFLPLHWNDLRIRLPGPTLNQPSRKLDHTTQIH